MHKQAVAGQERAPESRSALAPTGLRRPGAYLLYAVGLVLVGSQYFRGLFFPGEQLVALVLVGLLAGGFLLWQKGNPGVRIDWQDGFMLAFTLIYLLSPLWGINTRLSLQGGLKALTYLFIYWVVSRTIQQTGARVWAVRLLGLAAGLGAVGAIVLSTGWFHYPDALVGPRLAGGFQYPNAMAGYALFSLLLTLGLRVEESKPVMGSVWALLGYSALYAIFMTVSRGAWLVLPVGILIALLLAGKQNWVRVLAALLPGLAAVAGIGFPAYRALQAGLHVPILGWWAAGVLVTIALDFGLHRLKDAWRSRVVIGVTILALAAGTVGLAGSAAISQRFAVLLQGGDGSTGMRSYLIKDGIAAVADHHWVLGLGEGGWKSAFRYYRSAGYVSQDTHSMAIGTLTDVGILGFALFAGLLVAAAWTYWRNRRQDEHPALWAGLFAAVAALVAHSLGDFDLSYGSVALLFYASLGSIRALKADDPAPSPKRRNSQAYRAAGYGVALLIVAAIGGALSLRLGLSASEAATAAIQTGKGEVALVALDRAQRYDPLNADIYTFRGQVLVSKGLQLRDQGAREKGLADFARAKRLNAYDPGIYSVEADYLAQLARPEEAMESQWAAIQYNRYERQYYEDFFRYTLAAADAALDRKDRPKAVQILSRFPEGITLWDKMVVETRKDPNWFHLSESSPSRDLYWAKYLVYAGRLKEARQALDKPVHSANATIKAEGLLWLGLLDWLEQKPSADSNFKEALKMDQNLQKSIPLFQTRLKLAIGQP